MPAPPTPKTRGPPCCGGSSAARCWAPIGVSLLAGTLGYRYFEGRSWIDAFRSAAMMRSGMGSLAPPPTPGGKRFVSWYALYSGLAVVVITGITFAPRVYGFLYRLHLDPKADRDDA